MPLWFAVFIAVWSLVSVLASVIVGAFIMYCRQTEANPVAQLVSYFPREGEGQRKREEEAKGFYE